MSENIIDVACNKKGFVTIMLNGVPLYAKKYDVSQDELIYQTLLTATRTVDVIRQPYTIWFNAFEMKETVTNPITFPSNLYELFIHQIKYANKKATS